MVKFQRETAAVTIPEMQPLLEKHWEEIAHFKDIPLEPDFELYKQLDMAGILRVFTARDEADNKMVGYAVFFVKKNPHYSSSLQAVQDVLFIDPSRRGTGGRFIAWCDRELQTEGVQAVYHHVKQEHNFGPLLERFGYKCVDLIYTRRLDKNGS